MGRPVVHRSDEEEQQQQRDEDASHSLNALATEALDTVDGDDTEVRCLAFSPLSFTRGKGTPSSRM
jgi:hypothetical protein